MAFFCPVFPKHKFIDDYDSYDPLAQQRLFSARSMNSLSAQQNWLGASLVGSFPPYTTTRITCDFEATVDDEIAVRKEDIVIALYKEEDWLYVVRQDRKQGFVPAIYCELFISKADDKIDKSQQVDKISKSKEKMAMRRERSRSRPDMIAPLPVEFEKKRSGSLRKNFAATLLRHRSKSQDLRPSLPAVDEQKSTTTNSTPTPSSNVVKFLQTLHAKPYGENGDDDLHLSLPKSRKRSKSMIGLGVAEAVSQHRASVAHATVTEEDECYADDCGQAFRREPCGRFVVAFQFVARFADDVTVAPGQLVTALNRDDPDWTYVVTDGQQREGFLPASFIRPIAGDEESLPSSGCSSSASPSAGGDDWRGTELVAMRDFCGEARDDLNISKGDWLYSKQRLDCAPGGWLWVYCPRSRRSGFVPAAFVKTPMATVL
uniref:SH3 domain-containing protein n=1 Tax=Plectus sambesii TaxID=2011161 RepID=A0A914VNI9_9BILA